MNRFIFSGSVTNFPAGCATISRACISSISGNPTFCHSVHNTPTDVVSASPAISRLALLNRHLESHPNSCTPIRINKINTMSSQAAHPTLLIPGPIEVDDAVLNAMSHPSESHVGPAFVGTFGDTLTMLRQLFITSNPDSQPLVVSGSGTLGWDFVAANIIEEGDEVLVLHSGYFADSFADCISTYGGCPTQLKAPIGSRPSLEKIEDALKAKIYKAITITHVDTSTGVLSDIKTVSELTHRVSPNTLVIVDGVCSVGCEEIRFDEWGLDVVLAASQKAIGAPAGLCIMMLGDRAISTFKQRKSKPASYFANFNNWLPIMKNYEAKKPSYFATPSPQLIRALHASLTQILSVPLDERFAQHREVSRRVKTAMGDMGIKQLASDEACQANGMTAAYLPDGITATDLLPKLMAKGVILAGGLHREIATKYFRFGHMGVSVTNPELEHIDKAISVLKESLEACKK